MNKKHSVIWWYLLLGYASQKIVVILNDEANDEANNPEDEPAPSSYMTWFLSVCFIFGLLCIFCTIAVSAETVGEKIS